MNAKQAKQATKNAEDAHYRKISAEREEEDRKREAAESYYMKHEYHKFETEVYNKIRKATKNRERSIIVSDPRKIAWDRLEKQLRADGYNISSHYQEGSYENMGDFNAPYNVWNDPYWYYKVSW